jgi:hypothetical protein
MTWRFFTCASIASAALAVVLFTTAAWNLVSGESWRVGVAGYNVTAWGPRRLCILAKPPAGAVVLPASPTSVDAHIGVTWEPLRSLGPFEYRRGSTAYVMAGTTTTTVAHFDVMVSPLYPIGAACILPVSWVLARAGRKTRRARRTAEDRCGRCGYDLRATPARCPECGEVPRRAARAAA